MGFQQINQLGKRGEPFLFISDFKAQDIKIIPLQELSEHDIEFCIQEDYSFKQHRHVLKKMPLDFKEYKKKFDFVIEKIKSGETYLLNLTQATPIETDKTLKEIYALANNFNKGYNWVKKISPKGIRGRWKMPDSS